MRVDIKKALNDYRDKTGEKLTFTELGQLVWPDVSSINGRMKISRIYHGVNKTINTKTIEKIAAVLDIEDISKYLII